MPTLGNHPREFIRHNLLTLDAQLDNPKPELIRRDGTVWIKLVDVTQRYGNVIRNRNRKGLAKKVSRTRETWWTTPTHIYSVQPADDNDQDGFAAYICPYREDSTQVKMLGNDANVMFTSDMSGCTFGVGIPNQNGDVRVAHTNEYSKATGDQWNPNFAPQRQAQMNNLQQENTTALLVDPDAYRDNPPQGKELKAVTIGLRIKRAWEFWYQHHACDMTTWREKLGTTRL